MSTIRQWTRRSSTKEFPVDIHVTPNLTPLQLYKVLQLSKYKMYINFEVQLRSQNCYTTPQAISSPLFFCHLTRHFKSYRNFSLKEWANPEAGCPRRLWNLQSWRYLEHNSKNTQANTCKFKINIAFGQSTKLYELQSSPET